MFDDSRFIVIHGMKIHYRVIDPSGKARHRALLVASPGQSTANWKQIIPELIEADCQCVLCDLPGFGLSECRDDAPQDHETRAKILWGLLDTLDLEAGGALKCWHLMAHGSACGTIATMAMQQPDSAASLMMICPMLYAPLPPFLMKLTARPGVSLMIGKWFRRNVLPMKRFARLAAWIYGKPLPEPFLEQLHAPLEQLTGHEAMMQRQLTDGFNVDTARLNDLFMPAMVIWGGRDALLGGTIPSRLCNRDFKTAEYHVLAASGHCPAETNSRAIRDYLRGWIRAMWVGAGE